MKKLAWLLFIVTCNVASCQILPLEKVTLSISKDTLITTSGSPFINLDFRIDNCSNKNFIMYELRGPIIQDNFGATWPYCDEDKASAAIVLFVFDSLDKPVRAHQQYINDLKNPMTEEHLDSIMSYHRNTYLSRTVFLARLERQELEQKIDLQKFKLSHGQYFIQLLYFAGKEIHNFVTEEEIMADKRQFKAEVFQGCIASNKCILIVQ